MNEAERSLTALLIGTLSIAALHALIPSHWFSFAVVGRAQRWSVRQTLMVTAMAGAGHVLLTVALGLAVAAAGKALTHVIPEWLEHIATSGLLVLLGLYFLWQARFGPGCHHDEAHHHSEEPGHRSSVARAGANPTAIGALVLGMTLSPCLDLLSVYVAGASMSWGALLLISAVMAGTTVSLMVGLVWAALHGLKQVRWEWLERNESVVVGTALILLGLLLFVI
jgi:hypothetical protein